MSNRRLALIAWLLNCADWALTSWGLRIGAFKEMNPLLAPFVGSFWGAVLKVLLAAILFYFISGSKLLSRRSWLILVWVFAAAVAWNAGGLVVWSVIVYG